MNDVEGVVDDDEGVEVGEVVDWGEEAEGRAPRVIVLAIGR